MVTIHETHGHHAKAPMTASGMNVMGIMMGFCFGGTVLALTAPGLGIAGAIPLALLAAVGFGFVSLRYHQLMGGMMGICCGGGVLLAATPSLGFAALLVAIPIGTVIGVGSHKLMGHGH